MPSDLVVKAQAESIKQKIWNMVRRSSIEWRHRRGFDVKAIGIQPARTTLNLPAADLLHQSDHQADRGVFRSIGVLAGDRLDAADARSRSWVSSMTFRARTQEA